VAKLRTKKELQAEIVRLQQELKEANFRLKVPEDETDRIYFWLGRAVQKKRTERGISQLELATTIQMRRTSVANIEAGKQRAPVHTWMEVCEKIKLSFIELIEYSQALEADWNEANK